MSEKFDVTFGTDYVESEYGAKLVPDGKRCRMKKPFFKNILFVGDAAGRGVFVGPRIEGLNVGIDDGVRAANAVARSLDKDDFSENSIHFSYDLDADGIVEDEEDIRFFHEDQKLKRQIREGNRIALFDNVTDLKFTYLDVFDQPAANPAAIKTVVISMTVTEPAGRRQSLSRTYSTRVICRNLGL